jgi:hypothetical protein
MHPETTRRLSALLTVALPLTFLASPAWAQEGQATRERGSIVLGAFITNRDTTTRLDSDLGLGTDIDLEDDLGLDKSLTVFRLGGDFWVGERHRFDVSVFDLSRSSSRRIEKTIDFGDQTFEIDTTVNTASDLTIVKAAYTYAFLNRNRGYLGATGGLYVASTKLSLSEATLGTAESEDLTAPLPVVGLRGEYDLTDRISLTSSVEWFGIDTGDASGTLTDFYLAADYRLGNRWAVGLAYNDVSMNIKADESYGFRGELDWGYDGWLAYVKFDFGR